MYIIWQELKYIYTIYIYIVDLTKLDYSGGYHSAPFIKGQHKSPKHLELL